MNLDKATLAWTLPWDADWVSAVTFLGNSRRLAAGNNLGEILVWDVPEKPDKSPEQPKAKASSEPRGAFAPPMRQLVGHTNVVSKLLGTSDGRWLISASYDHTIRYWDMQPSPASGGRQPPDNAAQQQATVVLNARTIEEASSPAGRRAGRKIPPPIEAKVQLQQPARTLSAHKEWVTGLTMSRDEKLLLSGDDAGHVILWDRPAGTEQKRWQVKGWAYAVALSPDNKQALVSERLPLVFDSGQHSALRLWDVAAGQPKLDLSKEFKMYIGAAAWSPDGKLLVLGRGGESEGQLFVVDPATGKKLRELTPKHEYGITDLAFHPDGKHVASSGRDTVVRIWDPEAGKLVKELGKPRGGQFKDWIHAISFSADGTLLAAADMAGSAHVWSFE
jgi:WD40 repeat protein